MDMIKTLHRRDRGFAIGMTLIIAALIVMTGMIVRNQWIGGSPDLIDVKREWSVVLFFILPWLAAIAILLRYRKHLDRQSDYTLSIRDAVRALHEQNRFAQLKTRIILAAQIISLPLVALVIQQLKSVGKMRPHEATSAAVLFTTVLVLSIGAMFWELRRKLRPEQHRLEALAAEYDHS